MKSLCLCFFLQSVKFAALRFDLYTFALHLLLVLTTKGKKGETPDGVVAPANLDIHDESIDCVDAETALLPSVPDESQSPVSECESLDTPVENMHSSSSLLMTTATCPFLTSTTPVMTTLSNASTADHVTSTCYSSEAMASDADNEDDMGSDEQLEEWESDAFDP